jgi:tryptophan-rich sensory protein
VVAGCSGTVFVLPALKEWYVDLKKPTWCPPAGWYGPVWTVLYATLGYSAALVSASALPARRAALVAFGAHMAINLSWAPIFFGMRRVVVAAWWNVLLLTAALVNMREFLALSPLAGWLMAPYMVWCGFATALNFSIAQLNPTPPSPSPSA